MSTDDPKHATPPSGAPTSFAGGPLSGAAATEPEPDGNAPAAPAAEPAKRGLLARLFGRR